MSQQMVGNIQPGDYPGLEQTPLAEISLGDDGATRRLGEELAGALGEGGFVGLVGDLGAGKTTLVQGLVGGLDDSGRWAATSPTYSLIQIYDTSPPVFHMDLYRLEGWDDLESIGYWDIVEGGEGLACVEWLDRIPGAWPGTGMIVELIRHGAGRMARLWADSSHRDQIEEIKRTMNSMSERS